MTNEYRSKATFYLSKEENLGLMQNLFDLQLYC